MTRASDEVCFRRRNGFLMTTRKIHGAAARREVGSRKHRAAHHRSPPPRAAGAHRAARPGRGYWRSFWEGEDVFYGHVLGSKGLERAAVVLCINEAGDRDRARERLYVGMSRATDVLVVVGDPGVVRRIGGGEVAKRLGI